VEEDTPYIAGSSFAGEIVADGDKRETAWMVYEKTGKGDLADLDAAVAAYQKKFSRRPTSVVVTPAFQDGARLAGCELLRHQRIQPNIFEIDSEDE
jgi:hypothetical protein